jgi:membrane protein
MKYVTRKRILEFSTARTGRNWLKRIKFKRYDNLSLYKFLKIFGYNISEDEIGDRANGVSFNFILATFPAIIFLFTLIPYISAYFPKINTETIMDFVKEAVPASMYDSVASTVFDIVNNQRGGLLTFGFLFALYLSSNGMMSLMRAFNACYRTVERRNWFKMRLISVGLTLMLAVVLFSAIILLIVGQFSLDYVTSHLEEFSRLPTFPSTLCGNIHCVPYRHFIYLLLWPRCSLQLEIFFNWFIVSHSNHTRSVIWFFFLHHQLW